MTIRNDKNDLRAEDQVPDQIHDQMPFVIEHGQSDVSKDGHFTPVARLIVQPALRTSGLLSALPDREAKSLLLLLTYLTPNGRIEPTTPQLADALRVPEIVVRSRLGKLTAFRWRGERIAYHAFHETGLDGYRLSRDILAEETLARRTDTVKSYGNGSGNRDRIIAFNRARYARPREEVERDIERQLGYQGGSADMSESSEQPESPDVSEVRRRLLLLGIIPAQVSRLLAQYSLPEIREQLDWLPDRSARSPARYVVAAIEGGYEPPPRVRLERAIAEEEAEMRAGELPASSEETAEINGTNVVIQNSADAAGLPVIVSSEPILLYDSGSPVYTADTADSAPSGEEEPDPFDPAAGGR